MTPPARPPPPAMRASTRVVRGGTTQTTAVSMQGIRPEAQPALATRAPAT